MKAELDITITSEDMYRFSLHHAYTGSQGILSIIIAILCFILSVSTYGSVELSYTILYVVFGIILLFYIPVSLYMRSKRQFLLSEILRKPLHYVMDETGIRTSQNEMQAELLWEQVYKMVSTKHNVLIYSNRVNAFILPRKQIAGEYDTILKLAKAHLSKHQLKMK